MNPSTPYDVLIIGTGAGGGTLAWSLASSGARVLLLERGDYVRREPQNWSSHAVNIEGRYATRETWLDRDGRPLHPHTNYNVGGNTKFYGAALFRLRREDFADPHQVERLAKVTTLDAQAFRERFESITDDDPSPLSFGS